MSSYADPRTPEARPCCCYSTVAGAESYAAGLINFFWISESRAVRVKEDTQAKLGDVKVDPTLTLITTTEAVCNNRPQNHYSLKKIIYFFFFMERENQVFSQYEQIYATYQYCRTLA